MEAQLKQKRDNRQTKLLAIAKLDQDIEAQLKAKVGAAMSRLDDQDKCLEKDTERLGHLQVKLNEDMAALETSRGAANSTRLQRLNKITEADREILRMRKVGARCAARLERLRTDQSQGDARRAKAQAALSTELQDREKELTNLLSSARGQGVLYIASYADLCCARD